MSKQSYLSNVIDNKDKFNNRQVIMADEARYLFVKLGIPGYDNFIKTLNNNDIRHSKVIVNGTKGAVNIWKGSITIKREGYEEETSKNQKYSKNRAAKINNRYPLNSFFGSKLHYNSTYTLHE